MDGNDINFPLFNGNGIEDLEKHWFLCEAVWAMRQIQDEAIKQAQIITTLRSSVLD